LLIPDEDGYGPRSYLKDAARAQREYWVDQKRTYWPDYGPAAPTNWYKILWVTLFTLAALGLFVLYANAKVDPVHTGNTGDMPAVTIPSFSQYQNSPPPTFTCPSVTVAGQYTPAVCR
jgi:hypothetical protein